MEKYYFDTSIWLDFFENRDEPNLPKGKLASQLLYKILKKDAIVLYSDLNIRELVRASYSSYSLEELFEPLKHILTFVESTDKEQRLAIDLASKRNVPKQDALHALIARDNKAILVTLDNHFQKMLDIIKPKRPIDLI